MGNNFLVYLCDFFRAISAPNAEQYIKDKAEREFMCCIIDNLQNIPMSNKNELKELIRLSPNIESLNAAICAYVALYNKKQGE